MSGIVSTVSNALPRATNSIVNGFSSGNPAGVIMAAGSAKETLSGALTANTLATILSLSGGGSFSQLALYTKDSTARTLRLQIVIDGVTVFDSTSASISASATGIIAIGTAFLSESAGSVYTFTPGNAHSFNVSAVVKIASSLTETDKIALLYAYQLS